MSKCAWCKINVDKQLNFHADETAKIFCSCGAYNNKYQNDISLNSMKEIYDGALKLVAYVLSEVEDTLNTYDENLISDIKESFDELLKIAKSAHPVHNQRFGRG